MKKKWNPTAICLFSWHSCMISLSINAKECTTFHGEWFGTCSNDDLIELKIVQESCDSIEYKGES